MKISDYIYWFIIIGTAIFYLTIGNDMKKERVDVFKPKSEVNLDINSTK